MDTSSQKPLLFLDVDGVISLFGFREGYGLAAGNAPFADCPPGGLHSINGVMHYISADCGAPPAAARPSASSWSGRPAGRRRRTSTCPICSGCPGDLPYLTFDGRVARRRRPLEDRRDRRVRRRPPARLDRRQRRRVLPRLGRAARRRRRCSSRRVGTRACATSTSSCCSTGPTSWTAARRERAAAAVSDRS